MTTPSRPGKRPRPVWVLVGSTVGYEPAIEAAGGRRWRGEWSFWKDPTEQLAGVTRTSFAERQERDRRDEAVERAEKYAGYAARAQARAQANWQRSHDLVKDIPLGQPILVGHHSEQAHRNRLTRAQNLMSRGVEESKKAAHWEHRTSATSRKADQPQSVGFAMRRRDEALAAIRDCERTLDGTKYGPIDDQYRTQTEARYAEQCERLAYWQELLDEAGGQPFGPHNVKPGDLVQSVFGWKPVIRVNKKTVTVPSGYSWNDTIPWDRITGHRPILKADR